jgi:hypothetical protein
LSFFIIVTSHDNRFAMQDLSPMPME